MTRLTKFIGLDLVVLELILLYRLYEETLTSYSLRNIKQSCKTSYDDFIKVTIPYNIGSSLHFILVVSLISILVDLIRNKI